VEIEETPFRSYQQPDEATMLTVVLGAANSARRKE
jgi:hypothetical protein